MGIRVRLCADWCLREADDSSDYPQTSVSRICPNTIPIFLLVCRDYRLRTYIGIALKFLFTQKKSGRQTFLTTRMGFEPTTSAVTGRRSNQLSHQAIL